MKKETARKLIATLDKTANDVELLVKRHVFSAEAGQEILQHIDATADRIQLAAYGQKAFDAYRRQQQAKVIKKDSDEKYMDTFDNVQKPIQTDSDEPYMHHADGGFNSKGIDTYDSDDSSQVSGRDEYDVRDLSEFSDKTTKQPSWPGGSSGKSTRQGASVSRKVWAE
jgi:hypothetical protein